MKLFNNKKSNDNLNTSDKTKNVFENRYPIKLPINYSEERLSEARANFNKITTANIQRLLKQKNRPKSMEYFDNAILDKSARVEELKKYKAAGGKVIGVFCIQVPEELIYAAGCVPIRLSCGFYDAISPAEEIIPKNTCPLIKSSVGFNFLKINPLFELCDVIIIPTTCDGKKKMADILSNYHQVWTLELPNDKESKHSRKFWVDEIKKLKLNLENLTGNKITKDALKFSINMLHNRTALSRRLGDIRKQFNLVISGRDAYLIMQCAFFDDIRRWMEKLEKLIFELYENIKNQKFVNDPNAPRIHVTGSALIWPNMKVLHTIEESGAIVVSDDSCACGQYFYNPVEVSEYSVKAMIEGIADKALLPTVCPIFTHSDDRIDRVLELCQQYKVDGVVYHILRLCQVFDFEFKKVAKVLEQNKLPLLKIESEYSEEDIEQIKTRVEAFFEMINNRKELK